MQQNFRKILYIYLLLFFGGLNIHRFREKCRAMLDSKGSTVSCNYSTGLNKNSLSSFFNVIFRKWKTILFQGKNMPENRKNRESALYLRKTFF